MLRDSGLSNPGQDLRSTDWLGWALGGSPKHIFLLSQHGFVGGNSRQTAKAGRGGVWPAVPFFYLADRVSGLGEAGTALAPLPLSISPVGIDETATSHSLLNHLGQCNFSGFLFILLGQVLNESKKRIWLHTPPKTSSVFFTPTNPPLQRLKESPASASAAAIFPFHQAMLRTEKTQDLEAFSECSSGCQSGWTLYLCHSQNTSPIKDISAREDEEDDLSMLSDASSGPPNIKQDDYFNVCYSSNDGDDFPTSFSQNRPKRRGGLRKS
ncbi:hypothetical protein KSP40_PGU022361 [Platanthera guangdongensis]|uniref:Uncharacterized protein n=1 Tax=Platanthera guangdongensis TaxID=2320717 RepID=A0ABR2M541_9ASPA